MRRLCFSAAASAAGVVALGIGAVRAQGLDGERFVPAARAAGAGRGSSVRWYRHIWVTAWVCFLNLVRRRGGGPRPTPSGDIVAKPPDHPFPPPTRWPRWRCSTGSNWRCTCRCGWSTPAIRLPGRRRAGGPAGLGDFRLVPRSASAGWGTPSAASCSVWPCRSSPTGRRRPSRAPEAHRRAAPARSGHGARWFLTAAWASASARRTAPSPGNELTFGPAATSPCRSKTMPWKWSWRRLAAGCPTRVLGRSPPCRSRGWGRWSNRRPAGRLTPAAAWG